MGIHIKTSTLVICDRDGCDRMIEVEGDLTKRFLLLSRIVRSHGWDGMPDSASETILCPDHSIRIPESFMRRDANLYPIEDFTPSPLPNASASRLAWSDTDTTTEAE